MRRRCPREKPGALAGVEAVPDLHLKGFADPIPAQELKEVRSLARLA